MSTRALGGLSPETQVLFLAAGPADRDRDAQIADLLRGPFDWGRLLWLVERERAEPILHRRLGGIDGATLPSEQGDHLRKLAMVAEFRARHLETRLHEALGVLEQAGIAAMVLKGAALAYLVYDGFGHRPMGDLDLLILDPEEARPARDRLAPLGWGWSGESALADRYRGHHHLPPLGDRAGTGLHLELHTALFPVGHPFARFESEFKASRQEVASNGARMLVADQIHQLLHLCLHFAWSHIMQVGAWRAVRDISTMAERADIVWDTVTESADAYGAASCCYWTLRLAKTVAAAAVPKPVLARLRPPAPVGLRGWLERRYIHRLVPGETRVRSARLNHALWRLGVEAGNRDWTRRPWEGMLEVPPGEAKRRW